MSGFSQICCIVNIGAASKALKVAQKYGIINGTISIGRGTVNSRILEFLGINEERKEIVTMIIKSDLASEALKGIGKEMQFHKPYRGIAFSYSIAEFFDDKNIASNNTDIKEVKNTMYKIIYVIVDKGKAESVVDAAKKGGARGATIINARSVGDHEVHKLFSVEIEPQKEEVFIIAKSEHKNSIVESIKTTMKIDEPDNGFMFVVDVNDAYGLR